MILYLICIDATQGRNFYLAVPEMFSSYVTAELIVTTSFPSIPFTVLENSEVRAAEVVTSTASVSITISSDFVITTSQHKDRQKGIRVYVTSKEGTIAVGVAISTDYDHSYYTVYPEHDFGTADDFYLYFVMSMSTLSYRSDFILVASKNDTILTITPTETLSLPKDAQNSTTPFIEILEGSNHTLTLHELQTLLVFVESSTVSLDLSGTRIISNNPLTVITGDECAKVPNSVHFCERLTVQVPPTLTWGTEFLLAPFAGRTNGQYYKIIASEDSTLVQSNCMDVDPVSMNSGDITGFNTPESTFCSIASTKPVLVAQVAKGGDTMTGGDGKGDPTMSLVSPTQQYVTSTIFVTHQFESNWISVTVKSEDSPGSSILLDGLPFVCDWNQINSQNTSGYGCTRNIQIGRHNIVYPSGGLLSVIAYGWDTSKILKGYSYLTAMALSNIELNGNLMK